MSSPIIAMIGAGNMGGALLEGLIKKGFEAKKLWISDPSAEKLSHFKTSLGVNTTHDNHEAIEKADVIILAVKPQLMHEVIAEMADVIKTKKPLLISIAAGLSTDNFEKWLGKNIPLVRVMPNTAALIGESASGLFANPDVTKTQHDLAEKMLNAVGLTVWVEDETQMDTVTSLSGNGPAYFFLLIEMLENTAVQLGLPKDIANKLAKQTALGAAKLAMQSDDDVVTLRHKVTSKGGQTEAATKVLEDKKIRDIWFAALSRSNERAKELSAQFKKED